MRASIIIVSYQSAADLPACLDALRQTLGPEDEVIVVDNASTDGSADIAAAAGVTLARRDVNDGYGAGCNSGASLARGEVLVFLNPDTLVEAGWLEPLIAPVRAAGGLATPCVLLMDRPGFVDTIGNDVHVSGITVCRGYGRPHRDAPIGATILAVSGACFAIDRASFQDLGGFDGDYEMYLEDTDLSLRAALRGLPCTAVLASRVRHRHVARFSPRKLHWLERNRWRLLLTIWSGRTLLGLVPHLLLMELLTLAFAVTRGPEAVRSRLAVIPTVIQRLPAILARRRAVQASRRVPDGALLRRCAWRLDLAELVADPRLRRVAEVISVPPLALCQLWLRVLSR